MRSKVKAKVFFVAMLALLAVWMFPEPVQAQQEFVYLADTVSNSVTKTVYIGNLQDADSIKISLYCSGEIDLDTLGIKFKRIKEVTYLGTKTTVTTTTAKDATYSTVLTVNLADGVTSYTAVVVTIPKSAWAGYNIIEAYLISASSGNDETDTGQKAILSAFKY
jgi:hypothetical protein